MARQPSLTATNKALFAFYYSKPYVTYKDISEAFGVGRTTAGKVLDFCEEYAREHGMVQYPVPGIKRIPPELLFEAYQWDINVISNKVWASSFLKTEETDGEKH